MTILKYSIRVINMTILFSSLCILVIFSNTNCTTVITKIPIPRYTANFLFLRNISKNKRATIIMMANNEKNPYTAITPPF